MNLLKIQKILLSTVAVSMLTAGIACKSLIEVEAPSTSTNVDVVFSTDATAAAVMTAVYAKMNAAAFTGINSLSVYPELSGDNLALFATNNTQYSLYYSNTLNSGNIGSGPNYWNLFYDMIYNTNIVIERAQPAEGLSEAVKAQLIGEAYFMRAFAYFYLSNLYGDVPLVLTTKYTETARLPRTLVSKVMEQVISDLKNAQDSLQENYMDATLVKQVTDRLRPNKSAATALLARAYLFAGDYANAELEATSVISKAPMYRMLPLEQVFLKNSSETIWALQPVKTGENAPEGRFYKLTAAGPNTSANPVYLASRLMLSFENKDRRQLEWVDSVTVATKVYAYPLKYKLVTTTGTPLEFGVVLRLAEQYLIRSEARARQDNLSGARTDLNVIRIRAGLDPSSAASKEELLTAILKERRLELFTEWGHRWFDLKRTGNVNDIMNIVTPEKGGAWKSDWQRYPIPAIEIQKNNNLKQNDGYN